MTDSIHFEGAGDIDSWPTNQPGKPTQVAVFGMYHPKKGQVLRGALDRPVPQP